MALIDARIKYVQIRNDLITLLKNNVATLNTNLTAGSTFTDLANQIKAGDPIITPIVASKYPTILVKIVNKNEEFKNLGNSGRKRPEVVYRIYGITRIVSNNEFDTEIMRLTENIEAIMRDTTGIVFSSEILFSDLGFTDFGFGDVGQGVYVSIVAIDAKVVIEIK